MPTLPDARLSFFFRNQFAPEIIHLAVNRLEREHPEVPQVPRIFDGEARKKDTFSSQCVEMVAAEEKGIPSGDVVEFLHQKRPVHRRDIHSDDNNPPNTIEYDQTTGDACLEDLLNEYVPDSLSKRAAQLAKKLLTAWPTQNQKRAYISPALNASLGDLEQVDVSDRRAVRPKMLSVWSTQNIWHFLQPAQQEQYAKNLSRSQAKDSILVVGPDEAEDHRMRHIPELLQRNGYMPDDELNAVMQEKLQIFPLFPPESPFVYRKVE